MVESSQISMYELYNELILLVKHGILSHNKLSWSSGNWQVVEEEVSHKILTMRYLLTLIVSDIVKLVNGPVFITQPTKAVKSTFTEALPNAEVVLENNDPYAQVNFSSQDDGEVTSVITNGASVVRSLPVFSSNFSLKKVVSHVELKGDSTAILSLRDLNFPLLISQNSAEAGLFSRLAYNLANRFSTPVFHFFNVSGCKANKGHSKLNGKENGSPIENFDGYEFDDITSKMGVENFELVNNMKSKHLVVHLGALNDELVDAFSRSNVLLISVKVYKPFNLQKLLSLIPAPVVTLTFVQEVDTPSSLVAPLLLDFFEEYSTYQPLKNFNKVISAFFGRLQENEYEDAVQKLLRNLETERPEQNLVYGETDNLGKGYIQSHSVEIGKAIENVRKLEHAYIELLHQVNNDSTLDILNEFGDGGLHANPEFGFGKFLSEKEQQKEFIDLVSKAVKEDVFKSMDNAVLINNLCEWLFAVQENKKVSGELITGIIHLLETDVGSKISRDILEHKDCFNVKEHWLVGSDTWSYDLGSSGVHNVISSNENVNMLIIDSEPYKEKTNPNGLRKKDTGLYAMNYGNCYVASIAVYSSYTQVLQAFLEAQSFKGPSVILAYLPMHSEFDSALSILKETKAAVDTGFWPLYRYNPSLENENEVFKLDSSNIRNQLREFLERENRLTLLTKKNPALSRNLTASSASDTSKKQKILADEAYLKLLQGLSGPPVTVAFASDNGNAEGVAKRVHRQALGRGLKSVLLAMDDLSLDDLPKETNIVFVTSTSGQGEFPNSGKLFWSALKGANDLDLSKVNYSVFGLGDSEYWPRKEDKHYYNKPSKDLFAKMKYFGAQELAELGLGDDQAADGFNTGFMEWIPKIWKALGVDNVEGVEEPKPLTNEDMKIQSNYLRGTIAEGLKDESTGSISASDQQLTKFHGIYMQDDRDIREERKSQGMEPAYAFMVRLRLPGGIATPSQYLKMDELSDTRGNGTLKLTTRATFQLHGVVKHDLKPAIRGMNSVCLDTLAACGDVNRNVVIASLPHNAKVHSQVSQTGATISQHLLPHTTAYHEIWLEGEDESDKSGDSKAWENRQGGPNKKKTLVAGNALVDTEPLYGPTYLPRKFKVVIAVPPFNDVDVYAHDVGLIAIVQDNEVIGFNVLAGGGMGTTHNNKKTYPRAGSLLGYVSRDKIHFVCESIAVVQRDNGDRQNRKHARLKYTIDDMGLDVFKSKVEEVLGFKFGNPKPFEFKSNVDYFGWCRDEEGYNHYTFFIENGRVEDTPELPQKTGLKKIAEYLRDGRKLGEFRLTANQHLVMSKIADEDVENIKQLMSKYKLDNYNFSGLRLSSAACVAFPTCGLAMAESERYLPILISKLEETLEDCGLRHDSVVMRMTGCPNGCSRPFLGEVALVGKAYGAYNLLLGGGHHGQRLNKIYRYSIKEDEILDILRPLFKRWSVERLENEPFGDFCIRTGVISPTTEGKYFYDDIPEDS